jgi:hypothetical protein
VIRGSYREKENPNVLTFTIDRNNHITVPKSHWLGWLLIHHTLAPYRVRRSTGASPLSL